MIENKKQMLLKIVVEVVKVVVNKLASKPKQEQKDERS